MVSNVNCTANMMKSSVLLVLCFGVILILVNDCKGAKNVVKFFVSHGDGNDDADCTVLKACKSLGNEKIMKELRNEMSGKTIEINLNGTSGYNYRFNTIETTRNFTIKQWGKLHKPKIRMRNTKYLVSAVTSATDRFETNETTSGNRRVIKFIGLIFSDPILDIKRNNITVYIIRCDIKKPADVLVKTKLTLLNISLNINHLSCQDCPGIASFEMLVSNSSLNINGSTFISTTSSNKHFGVKIKEVATRITINIKHTTFRNIFNPFEVHSSKKNCSDTKNLSKFTVNSSNFSSNQKPVSVEGCFIVVVQKTTFQNNKGGLQIAKSDQNVLNQIKFLNNKNKGALVLKNSRVTNINKSQFYGNSASNGGAINSLDSQLIIQNSNFENNTAKTAGGAIYHHKTDECNKDYSSRCRLRITKSTLRNSPIGVPGPGTLIYSDAVLIMKDVDARVQLDRRVAYKEPIDAFKVENVLLSNLGTRFDFTCPNHYVPDYNKKAGSNKIEHVTLTEKKSNGKEYYLKVTGGMKCTMCPSMRYNYKPITLEVKGQNSTLSNEQTECQPCPDGGNCTQGLVSQDNYYGFDTKQGVRLLRCPDSYCCSKDTIPCDSYQSCSYNRTGVLCGTCKPPYTLDYFSNRCMKNGSCVPWLFWIILLVGTLLTIWFFMNNDYLLPLKRLVDKFRKQNTANQTPMSVQYQPTPTSPDQEPVIADLLGAIDPNQTEATPSDVRPDGNDPTIDDEALRCKQQQQQQGGLIDVTDQISNDNDVDIFFGKKIGNVDQAKSSTNQLDSSDTDVEPQTTRENQLRNALSDSEEELLSLAENLLKQNPPTETQRTKASAPPTVVIAPDEIISIGDDSSHRDGENFDPFSAVAAASVGGKEGVPVSSANPDTDIADGDDVSNDDVSILNMATDDKELTKDEKEWVNFFDGFLKIIFFYYYATAIVRMDKDHGAIAWLTDTFKFTFNFLPSKYLCPFKSMDRLVKDWLELVHMIVLISLPAIISTAMSFVQYMKSNKKNRHFKLQWRLKRASLNLATLSYTWIAYITFSMVTCVNINGMNRYYYEADTRCYTRQQCLAIAFIVYWVFPLPAAVFGIGKMLQSELITLSQFYIGFFCPWYTLYCLYIARKRKWKSLEITAKNEAQDEEIAFVLKGFYGPFRTFRGNETNEKKRFNWQAVILCRGLALSLFIPMIPTNGPRLIINLILLIAMTIHQVKCKPYNTKHLNRIAISSLTTLIILNMINILSAYSYTFAMNEKSPLKTLEFLCGYLQSVLVVSPVVVAMGALSLSVFRSIIEKLAACITRLNTGKRYGPQLDSTSQIIEAQA